MSQSQDLVDLTLESEFGSAPVAPQGGTGKRPGVIASENLNRHFAMVLGNSSAESNGAAIETYRAALGESKMEDETPKKVSPQKIPKSF